VVVIAISFHTLASVALPPLHGGQFASTQTPPVAAILIVGAGVLYGWGVRRVNRLQPRHRWSPWRTTAFFGGLFLTAVAVGSFIGVYDQTLFWDHMTQHLILVMAAAPLFAMAAPLSLVWSATTGRPHQWVTRSLRSPIARFFDLPVVAFGLYAVVIPVTHLTSFYNYTLRNEEVRNLEHVIFLVVGYLFWRQVFPVEHSAHRMHPALRMGYLFLAVPVDTFVGLSLNNESHEIFPNYFLIHRSRGPSLVTDLHLGGVIMWVVGDTLMTLAMIPVAVAWLRYEERKSTRVDRELDAMAL
jgi:putative copper resistance protein D